MWRYSEIEPAIVRHRRIYWHIRNIIRVIVFASSRTRYWSGPCMTGPGCFVYTGHIEQGIAIFARSSDFTQK